jgi:hypothetical protein
VSDELRAPRFVDSGNLSYYADPAGASVLNVVYGEHFGVNAYSTAAGYYVMDSASNDIDYGLYVASADFDGVFVGTAGDDGIHINTTTGDGIEIENAGWQGVYVGSAPYCGFRVDSANYALYSPSVNVDGVRIDDASDDGIEIVSASDDGVYVGSAYDGVRINSATDNGVYVGSAYDGVHVDNATQDGIEVTNAAYGVYVPNATHYGVIAGGDVAGGYFWDDDDTVYAYVAYGTSTDDYGILSNGTKSFAQQHPTNPDQVVVYAALEGGEAGTYYRGSAQLEKGTATIELPEHFSLVTEEEGLTVQVTPRQDCNGLYVAEVTTTKIVVKELQGGTSDARFDFFINGIRAGYRDFKVLNSASELGLDRARHPETEQERGQPGQGEPSQDVEGPETGGGGPHD